MFSFRLCGGLVMVLGMASGLSAATLQVPQQFQTIQAAIDAAAAGDTVLVAAGVYHERIQLAPQLTLRSAGDDEPGELGLRRAAATVIDGGGEGGEKPGVTMAAGATLDGFTVTNVGRYDEALWKDHHADSGERQKHEHIGHFGTPAIGVAGLTCTVTNNIVHHNGDTGIGIRGEPDQRCAPLVTHNVCYRNMGGGIGSMAGSTATIENNVCFQNFYAGIGHSGASPLVIGNVCYENIRAGIGISEGARPIVRGNKCYRNRRAGIGVRSGAETRPVVEDNECYENDMAGIGSEEHAQPVIRHNRCYRNVMAGIGSQTGARPVIVDNECFENKMAGIGTRQEARAVIVRNTCRRNEMAGIGVRSQAKAVVCDNLCQENRLVAIGLPDGASAVICGNELVRSGGVPPLVAVRGGATAVLADNRMQGGGVATLLVEGRAVVSQCRFASAAPGKGTAVWVWKNSQLLAAHCRFSGYQVGVKGDESEILIKESELEE